MNIQIFCCRHGQDEDNAAGRLNGHRDTPLTDLGLRQADHVATVVARGPDEIPTNHSKPPPSSTVLTDAQHESLTRVSYIFHSPLRRASVTAQTISSKVAAARLGAAGEGGQPPPPSCEVKASLIERDFGCMTGKPVTDILDLDPSTLVKSDKVNYFTEAEGSETFPALLARAAAVLTEVKAEVARREAEKAAKRDSAAAAASSERKDPVVVLLVCHGDLMKMFLALSRGMDWKEALLSLPYIANTDCVLL